MVRRRPGRCRRGFGASGGSTDRRRPATEQMMHPGEVVWIDFPGIVQTKRRPAVILSSALYHSTRPDVIVGLITSQIAKATAPTDHLLEGNRDGKSELLRAMKA